MPATRNKMSEQELLDRMQRVAEGFRPAAPIDRRSLFSGRAEQISEIFSVVAQPGQHAVIYGERGVGKTSLAAVSAELLEGANVLTARATCDVSDDFASVWRKALAEVGFRTRRQGVGFAPAHEEKLETGASALGNGNVTPDAVRTVLQRMGRHQRVAIFIDEFDRLRDPEAGVLFADTIKAMSDRVVPATLFLIGVADSVAGLIREHRSIERALVQIHMPRMSRDELAEIATNGLSGARMTIAPTALNKVTAVSQGLPHYTQLLTQLAANAALADHRAGVGARDVDAAVERAVSRAQGSVVESYRQATAAKGDAIYPQVLLACALANEDEFGFFGSAEVSEPLSKILGREMTPLAFARHLDRMSDESRGAILQKHGDAGGRRYRFENPLLQPYVLMRGLSEGAVRFKDLG
jgi:energy-coupling factor transporter ATP-binding protein EcfA2